MDQIAKPEPTLIYKSESDGDEGTVILEMRFYHSNYKLSDAAKRVVNRAAESILQETHAEWSVKAPEHVAWKEQWLKDAKKMFEDASLSPIYVEEIPNEYCGPKCCPYKVWLIVTSSIGRIKIGPRKRVLHIDWSDTIVKAKALDLFPNEDVTRGDHYIHAWTDEKAVEYLRTLAAEAVTQGVL